MSSESITTALFLITAVVASAVLINAMYPVIQNMAGTFSSSTHEADQRIRTDFKIIATHASDGTVQVWMKNVGSERIGIADIQRSDVFCGEAGSFDHLMYNHVEPGNIAALASGQWTEEFGTGYDLNANKFWDPGETVKITAKAPFSSGDKVFFQFALPDGIWRSIEFTAS
jgi:archaeal flagellar protein FlaG